MTKPKRVAFYARVSTGGQTVENQLRELQAVAERGGWVVVATFTDQGISGTRGRDKRHAFDAMLKAAVRREFDLVAAWSVDRLGRSLQDLIGFMAEIKGAGVDLYLHRQAIDTGTPGGRALYQMLGVFAEFEAAIIRERVIAGQSRAKAVGTKSGKPIGRPRIAPAKEAAVRAALAAGHGKVKAARMAGVGVNAVMRIAADIASA